MRRRLADELLHVGNELVLYLKAPRRISDVDDEEEIREQQRLDGSDAKVLQPFSNAEVNVEIRGRTGDRDGERTVGVDKNPDFFA